MMDDLDDLQASDQDSLDERIESEQRLRNQQLWTSFQNAACCITKLYKDRAQPNISPWVPFQNAASNLTTLYKDCIESQRKFARIGYQVGRRKRVREISKSITKKHHKAPHYAAKTCQSFAPIENSADFSAPLASSNNLLVEDVTNTTQQPQGQQQNNVASILNVNQLNLGSDESTSNSMPSIQLPSQQPTQQHQQQQQQSNLQIILGNSEDDLYTFQQALVQPAAKAIKSNQTRRPCANSSPNYLSNRSLMENKTEDEKLLELNQFLSEEYHRHVGSRKRSCSSQGASPIKRLRE